MYSHLDISHINQIRYNYIYVIHINDDTHTSNNHDYSVHDEIFLKQYIYIYYIHTYIHTYICKLYCTSPFKLLPIKGKGNVWSTATQ